MGKLLLWTITLIGLAPSVYLIIAIAYILSMLKRSPAFARYGDSAMIHDTYVSLGAGSMSVAVFPRSWAVGLIVVGIGCVLVGMVFLLHVPVEKT
jgi:hypothetical protein